MPSKLDLFFLRLSQVLRTDIVMDVGDSLNPAIDIGQVEGAFMQGLGLYTLEELRYSPEGVLLTRGPGTYKIPGLSHHCFTNRSYYSLYVVGFHSYSARFLSKI